MSQLRSSSSWNTGHHECVNASASHVHINEAQQVSPGREVFPRQYQLTSASFTSFCILRLILDLANPLRWKLPTQGSVLPSYVCLVLKLRLLPTERVACTRKRLKTFSPCYQRDRRRAVRNPSCLNTICPEYVNGFASSWLPFPDLTALPIQNHS